MLSYYYYYGGSHKNLFGTPPFKIEVPPVWVGTPRRSDPTRSAILSYDAFVSNLSVWECWGSLPALQAAYWCLAFFISLREWVEWNGINIEDRSFFLFLFCLPGLSPAWASWESLFERLANLGLVLPINQPFVLEEGREGKVLCSGLFKGHWRSFKTFLSLRRKKKIFFARNVRPNIAVFLRFSNDKGTLVHYYDWWRISYQTKPKQSRGRWEGGEILSLHGGRNGLSFALKNLP